MVYAIIGLGRSGKAARKHLLRLGIPSTDVLTFDHRDQSADFQDPARLLAEAKPDVLVVSPGVPLSLKWIQEAQANGVRVTSEISLACESLSSEKLIGVTGSVGKSTTVALLGEGALKADPHAFVGGNFGIPFCEYSEAVLAGRRPRAEWVILELSSFQLENCEGLSLDFAGITSLTSNHLERYLDREHYYETKSRVLDLTKSSVFINELGGDLLAWAEAHPSEKWVVSNPKDPRLLPLRLQEARLLGSHNQDNLALAAHLALAAGWPKAAIDAMKSFSGLPHRLESLPLKDGVFYVNDSKATAISSVRIAARSVLEATPAPHRVFLLLGGRDKNLPWEELSPLGDGGRFRFLFFGECGSLARSKTRLEGPVFATLDEALRQARSLARPGDSVLLSPGGTSLDEFTSFEHRGNHFKKFIENI